MKAADDIMSCRVQTEGNDVFWIVFTVIYVLCILGLTILVYYVGRWRLCKLCLMLSCFIVESLPVSVVTFPSLCYLVHFCHHIDSSHSNVNDVVNSTHTWILHGLHSIPVTFLLDLVTSCSWFNVLLFYL